MEFFGPGRLGSGFLIMEYEGYGVPSRVEGKRVGKMCEVIRTEDEISSSRRSKEGSDACKKLSAERESGVERDSWWNGSKKIGGGRRLEIGRERRRQVANRKLGEISDGQGETMKNNSKREGKITERRVHSTG